MSNVADVTFTGLEDNSRFGTAVSGGDTNGDSFTDAIIGAPEENTADVTISGPADNDRYGLRVNGGIN